MPCQLKIEPNICSCDYDGIILVSGCAPGFDEPEPFKTVLFSAAQIDSALGVIGAVLPINLPAKRLIYSPTGPLNMDYDDVRSFGEAATKGVERALKAGVRCPLFALLPDIRFENVELVTLLGALEGLYVPLEVRETCPDRCYKACQLAVWSPICSKKLQGIVKLAAALESGRYIARDIGGADPERMTPIRVEEYLAEVFCGSNVTMQVVSDQETLLQEYPLFACVNRAASMIPRHAGRIIFLTYEPANPACILETVMLVGKGVTYDTGGVDIKVGGSMLGMSRDKCGAAACAGFMQVVNLLQPPTVKVVAALCVVRNSVGENSYVADEIVTAKSGVRVRIGNTDAEGRLAMVDALCHIKEMALCSVNPHIFTVATLTNHAVHTVGPGYSIAIDNAVARLVSNAEKLQASGETMGDPIEISRLRREDFHYHAARSDDDVFQGARSADNAQMNRGHQGPCAFLIVASGLDKVKFHTRLRFWRRDLIAMANDGKDDNGSQFFFTLSSTPDLQNKHTIFGKVTGETIYNMLKLEEALVNEESEEGEDSSKTKTAGVKDFNLLSFSEEAEEDEEESVILNEKFSGKDKSAHDHLTDPKFSSQSALAQ
ncbi:Putative aminopeptidase W07G4.4 [Eufriesea mexicana]|uniref:Aminopeptidase W07G4.4 n=1 Tax=Eufriesea mexicana TaxID=516756 RepID=A0A310SIB5_9HYME|nr:Putative aminopeptidase W07G4.4 [Eufriesea mexicana]